MHVRKVELSGTNSLIRKEPFDTDAIAHEEFTSCGAGGHGRAVLDIVQSPAAPRIVLADDVARELIPARATTAGVPVHPKRAVSGH